MLDEIQAMNENEIKTVAGGGTVNYSGPCFVYDIKRGDCLSVLAKKYGTTVAVLQALNNIPNPDLIYAGNKLLIPYNG